jgi:hypothetical protein
MRNMIFFEFVQTNRAHEIHLNFVGDGEAAQQLCTGATALLRHGEQRRDVIAGMRIIRREKRVVHVEFAHGDAVSPRGPLAIKPLLDRHAEQRRALRTRMRERLCAGIGNGFAVDCGDGDARVINHAVDDHFGYSRINRRLVGGDGGNLPGELLCLWQRNFRRIDFYVMNNWHLMISH